MNNILQGIFVFLSIFSSQYALAQAKWSPLATLSIGNEWARGGETQHFYLQPDVEKNYVAHRETDRLVGGELFLGIQHSLNSTLLAQIGIAIAKSAPTNLQGDIWEDADPNFNNYAYRYKIKHSHVAIKGVLLMPIQYGLLPYISTSVGVASNDAYDFSITPRIEEETPPAGFNSHTENSFTYTLGVGVRKILDPNWQVGLSYEFADWGKSQLNPASGQTLNTGLKLDHLYTQGVFLNLTYAASV